MFLYTFAVFIFLMTQFVFASWNVCVTDQAKDWSSELEGKSLQWFLYCRQGGGGPQWDGGGPQWDGGGPQWDGGDLRLPPSQKSS